MKITVTIHTEEPITGPEASEVGRRLLARAFDDAHDAVVDQGPGGGDMVVRYLHATADVRLLVEE